MTERRQVTVRVKAKIRKQRASAEQTEAPTHRTTEIPRSLRLLALAYRWHRLIDNGQIKDQAEIARLMGLSRARVTQIMDLRWLPPQVQEEMVARRANTNSVYVRIETKREGPLIAQAVGTNPITAIRLDSRPPVSVRIGPLFGQRMGLELHHI